MRGEITFYVLAGIAILSAAMVVTRRKAFYAFLYFGLSLLASSGIFLQLYAPLLFVAQLMAIACGMLGIILFAVEVSTMNVALASAGGSDRRHPGLNGACRVGSTAGSSAAAGRKSDRAVTSGTCSCATARGGADESFSE